MRYTLIIGRSPGNIADQFTQTLSIHRANEPGVVYAPSQDELDVTDTEQVHKFIHAYGPFDEIVYCAAINELKWIKDIRPDDIQRVFTINYFGWVDVLSAHVEMWPGALSRAVAVVSDAATTPMRGSLMYNSSKAALAFSIRNLARELAPEVVVVGVSPTVVEATPMTDYIDEAVPRFRGWTREQASAYEASNIPIGRRVTKKEVAQTMLFALTGPEALTGSIIDIRGGK